MVGSSLVSGMRAVVGSGAVRRASLAVFGRRWVGSMAHEQLLPTTPIPATGNQPGGAGALVELVEEDYKWPVRVKRSPAPSGGHRHPPLLLGRVAGAILAGDGRVFDARYRLVMDSVATHPRKAFNPGPLVPAPRHRHPGPFLSLNWWSGIGNVYHWHRDVLSRAYALTRIGEECATLVVPEGMLEYQRHGVDNLVAMLPGTRVLPVPFGSRTRVETALVPSLVPYLEGSGYLHPEVARFVRDVTRFGVDSTGPEVPILLVSRAGCPHRRLANEAELADRLREVASVTVVEMEQLAFRDQVALAARARVVAGVFGAGLTHAYVSRGAGVLEVHNGRSRETHFATLAASLGIPYAQILGTESDERQDFALGAGGLAAAVAAARRMLA